MMLPVNLRVFLAVGTTDMRKSIDGLCLLAATLGLAQGVEFREKIPPAQSFASLPIQVGEWTGKRDVMEEEIIKELDLGGYVIVDFGNESVEDADKRLVSFTREIVPVLNEFLPK